MSSLIAKSSGGSSITPLDEGVYVGICTWLIDLGEQRNQKFDKVSHRVIFMWDIVGETVRINDKEESRTMNREYTLSLHERSGLRKDLQAWRGTVLITKLKGLRTRSLRDLTLQTCSACRVRYRSCTRNGTAPHMRA